MKTLFAGGRDFTPLMPFSWSEPTATKSQLDKAMTIWDLRKIAMRRAAIAFDYAEEDGEAKIWLTRARHAFEDMQLNPRTLRDVLTVDTSSTTLGGQTALPFGLAPISLPLTVHAGIDVAGATAAAFAGIPFTLSTLRATDLENVKAANPAGRNWFQLSMLENRDHSMTLLERAAAVGYDTLLTTVDLPPAGARPGEKCKFASIPSPLTLGTGDSRFGTMFDPAVISENVAWIRKQWPGKLVVKGIQDLEAARTLASMDVDGITLSSHGARYAERASMPIHLLPSVAREVGNDLEVHLDSGIMSGADIVAAIALGAKFTLIGRAYLYGMMAGGREGVDRAISILAAQIRRTMRQLGVSSLDELTPRHVSELRRLAARP